MLLLLCCWMFRVLIVSVFSNSDHYNEYDSEYEHFTYDIMFDMFSIHFTSVSFFFALFLLSVRLSIAIAFIFCMAVVKYFLYIFLIYYRIYKLTE